MYGGMCRSVATCTLLERLGGQYGGYGGYGGEKAEWDGGGEVGEGEDAGYAVGGAAQAGDGEEVVEWAEVDLVDHAAVGEILLGEVREVASAEGWDGNGLWAAKGGCNELKGGGEKWEK